MVVAPGFLAELRTTLDVVRRWRDKPSWREIEPSLKVGHQFAHTILKLHLADHLEASGHEVQIVPRRPIHSPDLQFHAIGGPEELVHVECYRPIALSGEPEPITIEKAKRIVEEAMGKAKKQLPAGSPGFLAIGGYNVSDTTSEVLKHALASRLR